MNFQRQEEMMNLPEYISKDEVRRVCTELKFRDWSGISEPAVTREEAATVLKIVNTKQMVIAVEDFQQGLEVELEHGTRYEDANVTNNHPLLTGMIVLAHLKETGDYYKRILVAEMEGDLLKAIQSRNIEAIVSKYASLVEAHRALNAAVEEQVRSGQALL
jgi:hypothetical protein